MTVKWFGGPLSIYAVKSLHAALDNIPASTKHEKYIVSLAYAQKEYELQVSSLVDGDLSVSSGSRALKSREPHVYVRHEGYEPYLMSVFKDARGQPFVRIYINPALVDVILVDTEVYLENPPFQVKIA